MVVVEVLTTNHSRASGGPSSRSVVVRASGPLIHEHHFSMGRTLHYAIFGDPKTCRDARAELRVALHLLIYRFTWTCEEPSLYWLDEGERLDWSNDNEGQEAPIADCYVKVADDEWNAVLVTRFVAWLSRRLPTATVTLRDEGHYLTPGYLVFRAGVPDLDHARLAKHAKYLTENRLGDCLQIQEAEMEAFKRGEIHTSVSARDYLDRREIRALGFSLEVLARMTLDEVADAMTFPWTTEGLKAA